MKQRILGLIMAIVMVIGISTSILPLNAYAANNFNSAQLVYVNSSFSDNNTNGFWTEQNYYRFYIDKPGSVDLMFSNPLQGNQKMTWIITLYTSSNEEIVSSDIYGNNKETKLPSIGLSAGTYYIGVRSAVANEAVSKDMYTININFTASNYWEKEFNNSYNTATCISLNKTYSGTTHEGSNISGDYYSFTTNANGYIRIDFSNALQGHKDKTWKFVLFDSSYEKIFSVDVYGNKNKTYSPKIGLGAGTYYVYVCSAGPYTPISTEKYNFKVSYKTSNFWEKEFNEDFNSANNISINTTYNGTITNHYCYDYFKFKISKAGNYIFKISSTPNSNDYGWIICIYDNEYNEIEYMKMEGKDSSKHVVRYFSKGNYYIKIQSYSSNYIGCVSGKAYQFYVNTYVPKVSGFKFAGASESAIKLTWNKVSGATGYVVYRYNNSQKSWTRLGVVTANTYTDKKLKSGTTYKYAVRAYKKVDSKTIYSVSYPTVNACTDPATVNFKLTAGSKKATVSWSKVSGASGYIVYYKTSKNGSWKKLKTTTSTSYTKTGLTKGKTYYFTVKAYKNLNGKSYGGKYVTKSVKVK